MKERRRRSRKRTIPGIHGGREKKRGKRRKRKKTSKTQEFVEKRRKVMMVLNKR